jgi:hypothetical protein
MKWFFSTFPDTVCQIEYLLGDLITQSVSVSWADGENPLWRMKGTFGPKGLNNFAESGVKHVHAETNQTGCPWNPAPCDWSRNWGVPDI